MQAAYSTTADVKAQKAVRREWASYQVWLFDHYRSLENREHEISNATLRKKAKMDKADKQLILGLHEEFLTVARSEWLNRIRHGQLQIQKWIMTPDEKHVLQQTLHWSQKDMLEAYAREQAQIGMKYRRVDPNTLGTKEPTGRPMPSLPKEDRPAYAKWASELSKMSTAPQQRPQPSVKPPELPSLPLYYIGALLQGTDLDTVAASDLEAFALHASEEKIREYYTEACEASVHFQRLLPTLDASERTGAQENFDRRMRDLAIGKERDWKVMTVKELRKYQALEMERRQAQQRAMRPSPRPQIRRDVRDWDYGDVPRRRGVRRRPEQEPEPEYEKGGVLSTVTGNPLRNETSTRAAGDWSSVLVDEMDFLLGGLATGKARHAGGGNGNGSNVLRRRDGPKDKSRLASREKITHQKNESAHKQQKVAEITAKQTEPWLGRRRGVSDEDGQIPAEGEIHRRLGTAQANEANSQHRQLNRLGTRFGIERYAGSGENPTKFGAKGGGVGFGTERRPKNVASVIKRVRFTPSAASTSSSDKPKYRALHKTNFNESRSRFYEGLTS